MKFNPVVLFTCGALALSLPAVAQAGPDVHKSGHGAKVIKIAGCPPGLAKKGNGCQPPGQAKKQPYYGGYDRDRRDHDRDYVRRDYDRRDDDRAYNNGYEDGYVDALRGYRIGDYIRSDYVVLDRPSLYGLDPGSTYYRANGGIYQVDRQTQQILGIIGLASSILN